MAKKSNLLERAHKIKIKTAVERAVEILKEEPNLKYYEAIEKAKSEINEME